MGLEKLCLSLPRPDGLGTGLGLGYGLGCGLGRGLGRGKGGRPTRDVRYVNKTRSNIAAQM